MKLCGFISNCPKDHNNYNPGTIKRNFDLKYEIFDFNNEVAIF